jgi:hypothetical protein
VQQFQKTAHFFPPLATLDEAMIHAQPEQKMVLAYVLGYRRAAQQAAAWVPDSSAARAFMLHDNQRLQALASDSGSGLVTRYLWLRRSLLDGHYPVLAGT